MLRVIETYLTYSQSGALDEDLFLLITRIRMIEVLLEPDAEHIGDLLGQVAPPSSTVGMGWISHHGV